MGKARGFGIAGQSTTVRCRYRVLYHILKGKKKNFYKVMTVSTNLSYLVFMVSWVTMYFSKDVFLLSFRTRSVFDHAVCQSFN